MTRVQVETTPEQAPMAFALGGRQVQVCEVIDRWPGKDYTYYKVRDERNTVYILRHDLEGDFWEITLLDTTGTH